MPLTRPRLAVAALACGLLATAAATPAFGAAPQDRVDAVADAPAATDELLVGYVDDADEGQRARARAKAQADLAEVVVPKRADRRAVELVKLSPGKDRKQAIDELRSDPAVAYAEPNWIYTHQAVTDPSYLDGSLWGMYGDASSPLNQYGSQAAEAWTAGHTGASSVYIGVIDEGIQFTHPDLAGQVWTNPGDPVNGADDDGNGYVDDVNGWDFANRDNSVYDGGKRGALDDHGTHVAGTIGAKADGAGVVGVNHAVTLISGKFLGRSGGAAADAARAIDYFTDLKRRGVNVVATNNSWGGGGFSQTLLDAINRGGDAGILFIAAAGNGGSDGVGDDNDAAPHYPANYQCTSASKAWDCVISVAAIDKLGRLATFTNVGASSVDLGAPGVGVLSTTAFDGYSSYNGTSMATPHVSGGAALYAASHPGATAQQVKAALLSSSIPTASLSGRTATGGRLNVSGF